MYHLEVNATPAETFCIAGRLQVHMENGIFYKRNVVVFFADLFARNHQICF